MANLASEFFNLFLLKSIWSCDSNSYFVCFSRSPNPLNLFGINTISNSIGFAFDFQQIDFFVFYSRQFFIIEFRKKFYKFVYCLADFGCHSDSPVLFLCGLISHVRYHYRVFQFFFSAHLCWNLLLLQISDAGHSMIFKFFYVRFKFILKFY